MHTDETNLIQTYRIKVSIVDSAFWIIQSEHTRRNLLRELISSFKIKYLNQKKKSFAFMRLFRLWTLYKWATTSHYNIFVHRYSSKSIRTVIWVCGGDWEDFVYPLCTMHRLHTPSLKLYMEQQRKMRL